MDLYRPGLEIGKNTSGNMLRERLKIKNQKVKNQTKNSCQVRRIFI